MDIFNVKIVQSEYGEYCIPESSYYRPSAQAILKGGLHEEDTLTFIRDNSGDGDIIQAGAYYGDFLPILGQVAKERGSHIWSFEPSYENYRCAKITLAINDINSVVTLFNYAVSSNESQLWLRELNPDGSSCGGAKMLLADGETNIPEGASKIKTDTIDNVIPSDRKVSIIQLDVEGHEERALIGAYDTIKRNLPIIIVEIWESNNVLNSLWVKEKLFPLGYKFIGMLHDNAVLKVTS